MKIRTLGKLLLVMGLTAVFGFSAQALTEQQLKDLEARIKPVGQVCIEGDDNCGTSVAVASDQRSGSEVFDSACMACHTTGAGGAPIVGDVAAWADRISQGIDALYSGGIDGVPGTGMIAKGGCMNCSDDEVKAAVDYMLKNTQ